jgi:hypothetical protein
MSNQSKFFFFRLSFFTFCPNIGQSTTVADWRVKIGRMAQISLSVLLVHAQLVVVRTARQLLLFLQGFRFQLTGIAGIILPVPLALLSTTSSQMITSLVAWLFALSGMGFFTRCV